MFTNMATKIMWTGGAVLAIGVALAGIGLAFFIGGVTWPALAEFEGLTFATLTQVQWEGATLRTLGLYLAGGGVVILLLGGLMGGFGYLRRRGETV